jgi:chemotaxis protein histidine kinase CheA
MKPNFTAVNSPLVADDDRSPARPSPRTQPRARRSLVVAEEQDEEEAPAVEEPEVEEQEVEAQAPEEADQEDPEQEAPAQEAENDDEEHEFKRIMDHRWVGDKIELRIEWSDGERTWTDEEIFHEDSPEALFEFWRNQPGGRPPNPNDPDVYQVFAIRKHRTLRGKKQVLVEWLGYDSSEHTWENQSYIEQVAKDHVDEYMSKLKGKGKANTKTKTTTKNTTKTTKKGTAKTVAKGRGRPKAETKSSTRTIAAPVGKTLGRSRVTKR